MKARVGKAKTPARRSSTYPWETIKAEYVTGALERTGIVEKYGMAHSYLDTRMAKEDWLSARIEFRRTTAERALAQAKVDVAERLEASIKAVYNIKIKVLQALRRKVDQPQYDPTVRDLEILQKLELELIGAKDRTPDGINVNVTFEAKIENLMTRVADEREAALREARDGTTVIDVPATVSESMSTPGPTADFMFGDLNDEDDDADSP